MSRRLSTFGLALGMSLILAVWDSLPFREPQSLIFCILQIVKGMRRRVLIIAFLVKYFLG